nr:hypothetical protein [uncultured Roseateles sp.]
MHFAQQQFDLVAAFQQGGDHGVIELALAGAQRLQQGFGFVGKGHHRFAAEHAGRALDGVGSAEGRVQAFRVTGVALQNQQALFELAQHLLRLVQKAGAGNGQNLCIIIVIH